ncbi:protein PET100 homolog, mitochondrial-like [Drosophila miranda]|uniref:protein PET100 homolog, mitochondrial-like n=1 Tax=Drosophila miranda TaxID=7229 RepID=UPI00143F4061|nr:protein PET100 homolog, mitochondrial-like [Drosophila miranda]
MGTWVLEVAKMGMYMAFPVALFHIFNQTEYFDEWVTKKKRELYPPEHKSHREELQCAIREHHEKHDAKMMRAMEEAERKK